MIDANHAFTRMRQILLSTADKQRLMTLKDLVRNWHSSGGAGQDAINRAVVRAIEEVQNRLDQLMKV